MGWSFWGWDGGVGTRNETIRGVTMEEGKAAARELRGQNRKARKKESGRMLGQFCELTGYNRSYATRALGGYACFQAGRPFPQEPGVVRSVVPAPVKVVLVANFLLHFVRRPIIQEAFPPPVGIDGDVTGEQLVWRQPDRDLHHVFFEGQCASYLERQRGILGVRIQYVGVIQRVEDLIAPGFFQVTLI